MAGPDFPKHLKRQIAFKFSPHLAGIHSRLFRSSISYRNGADHRDDRCFRSRRLQRGEYAPSHKQDSRSSQNHIMCFRHFNFWQVHNNKRTLS